MSAALSLVFKAEVQNMIASIRGYQLIQGTRGQDGVNEDIFIAVIQRFSALVEVSPEIIEMDVNPLLEIQRHIIAVDLKICVEK